jgi:hypothetical protein
MFSKKQKSGLKQSLIVNFNFIYTKKIIVSIIENQHVIKKCKSYKFNSFTVINVGKKIIKKT